VPHPEAYPEKALQMLITTLDYSDYLGRIGIGRVVSGTAYPSEQVVLVRPGADGGVEKKGRGKVSQAPGLQRARRVEAERIEAGDLCAIAGSRTSTSATRCAIPITRCRSRR
jgi:GTP-binding protein